MNQPTKASFKDWLKQPETVLFMEGILRFRIDADLNVHKCLDENEKERAALFNAGMTQLEYVIEILPQEIIDTLGEE